MRPAFRLVGALGWAGDALLSGALVSLYTMQVGYGGIFLENFLTDGFTTECRLTNRIVEYSTIFFHLPGSLTSTHGLARNVLIIATE